MAIQEILDTVDEFKALFGKKKQTKKATLLQQRWTISKESLLKQLKYKVNNVQKVWYDNEHEELIIETQTPQK